MKMPTLMTLSYPQKLCRSFFFTRIGSVMCIVGILASLTGCGSLPSAGPSTAKIIARGKAENKSTEGKFIFIPVTQSVLAALKETDLDSENAGFRGVPAGAATSGSSMGSKPVIQKIAIGDVIGVTIYTTGGGLFGGGVAMAQSGGGSVGRDGGLSMGTSVPPQTVDSSEAITVPFVGRVKVVGREPNEVESEITDRMKGMAFTPYAVVTVGNREGGDLVTVTGDVKNPHRVQVPLSGLRIIDALSEAGGCTEKSFETTITLVRGGRSYSGSLSEVLNDPASNIYLQPSDTLIAKGTAWSYTAFGATGQTLRPFETSRMSIAEALGNLNGLDDNRANPEAVFIYRMESVSVLRKLGGQYRQPCSGGVPVIYQVNLRDPNGFFMAKQFAMKNKDLIYVGNAGSVAIQKVMLIIGSLTSPVVTGLSATSGVGAVKTLSQ